MAKILTIVIPTYNMEKYLDKCLTSLIIDDRELMQQLEVLVINDGSKDKSSEIGHLYQEKYPDTIRVIDKENGNYGSCINRGLKEAKGAYIKILDADDSFEKEVFALFLLRLRDVDVDSVITDFDYVDTNGQLKKKENIKYPHNVIMNLSESMKYHPLGLTMHAITYKTEMLKRINYVQPEGISYTDQIWVNEPLASCSQIIYMPILIYKYLIGREGQTMSPKNLQMNISHQVTCAIEMVKTINKFSVDTDSRKFVTKKALHTLKALYLDYLYHYPELGLEDLDALDSFVYRENMEIYEMLNNSTFNSFIKYKFIKEWRQHKLKSVSFIEFLLYKFSLIINRLTLYI